jgi:hypothetical protein
MTAFIGFALALVISAPRPYEGPNGFDPSWISIVNDGGALAFDEAHQSGPFIEWLTQGTPEERESKLDGIGYFIACALDQGTEIRFRDRVWRGHLGLAPSLRSKFVIRSAMRRLIVVGPTPDEGKWISSCLMAFANLKGSHEYILMRGNFPNASAHPLTAGQRWTMGYPEGVFFADLINFNHDDEGRLQFPPQQATPAQKARSFTLSLNLPENYRVEQSAQLWAPPNASNGRSLDYSNVSMKSDQPIATRLGAFQGKRQYFRAMERPTDPNYRFDVVCVSGQQLAECQAPRVEFLRPIFVHAPRMVSLASAKGNVVDGSLSIQALDSGKPLLLEKAQKRPCEVRKSCSGQFQSSAVGEAPRAPVEMKPRTLAGLQEGQSVTVLLRFDSEKEHYQLSPEDLAEPFTAVVRYRSSKDATARIEILGAPGAPLDREVTWNATHEGDWALMQVFPVYADLDASGEPLLKLKISGVGDGTTSPELDLAGFVSAQPWCLDGVKRFAGRCPDESLPIPQAVSSSFRAAMLPR